MNVRAFLLGALALSAVSASAAGGTETFAHPKYDYPTAARADYVIGCLASNGFSRLFLDKCACEIDTVANFMSYDDYEKASTILSLQQGGALGQRGGLVRDTPIAKDELAKLRSAQAEANLRCI